MTPPTHHQLSFADLLSPNLPPHSRFVRRSNSNRPLLNWFLGLRPDQAAADAALQARERTCAEFGIRGPALDCARLHVSLHGIYEGFQPPPQLLGWIDRAMATIEAAPFVVEFDQVLTFRRNTKSLPLVLAASDGSGMEPLLIFHRQLGAVLRGAGLGLYVRDRFTPHMTLLYGPHVAPGHRISPVKWTAREFVLIESEVGNSRHNTLRTWPLHTPTLERHAPPQTENLFFAEKLTPCFEPLDLDHLCSEVRTSVLPRIRQSHVELATTIECRPMIVADRVLLQRMLTNLVNNAIDASPPQRTVSLHVTAGRAGGIRFEVSDQGCGIPPENLSRIFDPYFTSKEFGERVRGFGLGLTIVQKIILLHHGRITVESQRGQGTTFRIDIPPEPAVPVISPQHA